jgi:hypothetical protein
MSSRGTALTNTTKEQTHIHTTVQHLTHKKTPTKERSGSEAAGHGSQPTMSR